MTILPLAEACERARNWFAQRLLDEIERSYPELFARLSINESDSPQSVIDALVGAATNKRGEVQLQVITVLGSWPRTCGKEAGGLGGISFESAFDCRSIADALLTLTDSSPAHLVASLVVALGTFASFAELKTVQSLCRLLDRVDIPPLVKITAIEVIRSCKLQSASAAVPTLGRLFSRSRDEKLGIEIATTLQEFQTDSRDALAEIVAVASDYGFSERLRREAGLALLACKPGDIGLKAVKLSVDAQAGLDETLRSIGSSAAAELRDRMRVLRRDSNRGTSAASGTPPAPVVDNQRSPADSSENGGKKGDENGGGGRGSPAPQTQIPESQEPALEPPEARFEKLEPAVRNAYWAFQYAVTKTERSLEDRQAREYLMDHGTEGIPELANYTLPSLETFRRYLSAARNALGELKYTPRVGRPHGGSIVKRDEL